MVKLPFLVVPLTLSLLVGAAEANGPTPADLKHQVLGEYYQPDVPAPRPTAPFVPSIKVPMKSPFIKGLDAGTYPRVYGTATTRALSKLMAAQLLGLSAHFIRPGMTPFYAVGGTDFPPLEVTRAQKREWQRMLNAKSDFNSTRESYEALTENQADLILVPRLPSEAELAAAREKNVDFDIKPVALDALVFLEHVDNPVGNLPLEQVRAIYSGQLTNWQEADGSVAIIHPYIDTTKTDFNAAMQDLMQGHSPITGTQDRYTYPEKRKVPFSTSNDSLRKVLERDYERNLRIDKLRTDTAGLAYSMYYDTQTIKPLDNVRLIRINGVAPNASTIASGKYPLVRPIYAVTRKNAKATDLTGKVREWLLSNAGQKLVRESGYIPFHPAH